MKILFKSKRKNLTATNRKSSNKFKSFLRTALLVTPLLFSCSDRFPVRTTHVIELNNVPRNRPSQSNDNSSEDSLDQYCFFSMPPENFTPPTLDENSPCVRQRCSRYFTSKDCSDSLRFLNTLFSPFISEGASPRDLCKATFSYAPELYLLAEKYIYLKERHDIQHFILYNPDNTTYNRHDSEFSEMLLLKLRILRLHHNLERQFIRSHKRDPIMFSMYLFRTSFDPVGSQRIRGFLADKIINDFEHFLYALSACVGYVLSPPPYIDEEVRDLSNSRILNQIESCNCCSSSQSSCDH